MVVFLIIILHVHEIDEKLRKELIWNFVGIQYTVPKGSRVESEVLRESYHEKTLIYSLTYCRSAISLIKTTLRCWSSVYEFRDVWNVSLTVFHTIGPFTHHKHHFVKSSIFLTAVYSTGKPIKKHQCLLIPIFRVSSSSSSTCYYSACGCT